MDIIYYFISLLILMTVILRTLLKIFLHIFHSFQILFIPSVGLGEDFLRWQFQVSSRDYERGSKMDSSHWACGWDGQLRTSLQGDPEGRMTASASCDSMLSLRTRGFNCAWKPPFQISSILSFSDMKTWDFFMDAERVATQNHGIAEGMLAGRESNYSLSVFLHLSLLWTVSFFYLNVAFYFCYYYYYYCFWWVILWTQFGKCCLKQLLFPERKSALFSLSLKLNSVNFMCIPWMGTGGGLWFI